MLRVQYEGRRSDRSPLVSLRTTPIPIVISYDTALLCQAGSHIHLRKNLDDKDLERWSLLTRMECTNSKDKCNPATELKKKVWESRRLKIHNRGKPNLVVEIPTKVFDNLKRVSSNFRRKLVRSTGPRSLRSLIPAQTWNTNVSYSSSSSIKDQCMSLLPDSTVSQDCHFTFGSLDSFDRSELMAVSGDFQEFTVPVISDYEDENEETVNGTISSFSSEESSYRCIFVDTADHPDFSKKMDDSLSYSTDGSLDESDLMYHVSKWRLLPSKLFDDGTLREEEIHMTPLPLVSTNGSKKDMLTVEMSHRQ